MLTANVEERSSEIMDELFGADGECDDVRLDLDFLRRLMGGPASPSQGNTLLDIFPIDVPQGVHNSKDILSPKPEIPEFGVPSSSHNSEASGSGIGSSDGSSESAGTSSITVGAGVLKPSSHSGILENSSSRTLSNFVSVQENSLSHICMVGGPQTPSSYCQDDGARAPFGTPNHRGPFCSYAPSHVTHDGKYSAVCHMNNDKDLFGCSRLDFHFGNTEDALVIDGDRTSQEASYTESSSCEINMADAPVFSPEHSDMYLFGSHDLPYIYFSSGFQSLAWDGSTMVNTVVNNMGPSADLDGTHFGHQMLECGNAGPVSLQGQGGFIFSSDMRAMQDEPKTLSSDALSCIFSKTGDYIKVEENVESITSSEIVSKASEVVDDKISRRYCESASKLPSTEGIQGSSSDSFALVSCKKYVSCRKDEKENIPLKSDFIPQGMIGEINPPQLAIGAYDCGSALQVSGQPGIWPLASLKADMDLHKGEYEVSKFNSYLSNFYQEVQHNKLEHSNFNGDFDVCILEGIPAVTSDPETLDGKLFAASQISTLADPNGHMVMGHSKLRPDDERVIFRVAVQDLSQPKSEAIPPDGVLAVPLMKHQRIALSWMINKETKGECCSGGILADDQGLGKTVSTIALILTERPPSSKAPIANKEQCQKEMFDLNEDNGASETYYMEDPREVNGGKTYLKTKGRPSAGTLIVCPTSVLRQWSEELHNKVTREADLSVLVYHGSSRTKDPLDLAQYDVVITTYAIVSKEVENQPGVNEDDDPTGTPLKGDSSTKKRKILQTASCKKSSRTKKSNKEIDNELLETISGPLAEVGWFRVVLDEAQTIKNHKTLVARACWGLRAKRRWCLSGTPIQNAIDDLYSYFRFLRHDPYATFQIFLENIKSPIQKNPEVGYRKLQAVLKTIMLRRTKGTCIDGEPIVNLPPKTIELKRVDFSIEEHDFYCRLEADSQAQFAEYAKAGTVKQNYVNILLMLLRLRQACNHPLLVRGLGSTSQTASSIEMAKKLPPEKTIVLLNCLEASLAICGICRDPPEDAVVTLCGHVFCNQCILPHMNGDEKNCPNKSCKAHLTPSNIFSITTLHGAISESLNPHINHTSNCSDSELAKPSESCALSYPEGSSKIKAALKLLTSLSKPHDPSSVLTSLKPTEGCYGCDSVVENGTKEIKDDSYNPVMGEKAIVFSQWTRMLDFLEDGLKNSSIQYRRLDGTMPIAARDRAVKDFTTLSQVTVMIMSLKAASLGLNVVAACHVILLDLWWNPTTEDQAIDRAHRIGQTRPVSVYRLTVRDTVEDRILALQERKRQMVASAFGEDEVGNRQTRLTVDDLKYLFRVD